MTVLLLGAGGQLGRALRHERGGRGREWTYADRHAADDACIAVDAGDPQALLHLLDTIRPSAIVNAAAWTAVDRAEADEAGATRINATAVGVMGEWAQRHGSVVIHVSTDYVFDGTSDRPYREDDPPGPINAYGRTKLAGEQALTKSGAAHMILRTAWLYSAGGPSFLGTILRLAAERDILRIVADQHGCPTSAAALARAVLLVLDKWMKGTVSERRGYEGVYHVVADGQTSWHGFAQAIVAGAAARGILDGQPSVLPIATDQYPTPARRPSYSVLDNSHFKKVFSCGMAGWETLLQEALDDMQPLNRPE
jgi:dTDP-4-dehydrorhamnose reductase